jgi:hypothetical protein
VRKGYLHPDETGYVVCPDNVFKAATTAVGLAYDDGMTPDEFVVSDPYQCFTATDPAILDYKQKAWTDQIGVNPGS